MSTENNTQHFKFPLPTLLSHNFSSFSSNQPQNQTLWPPNHSFNYQHNLNLKYFEEYKKLYFTAYCISLQFKNAQKTNQDLIDRLNKIEAIISEDPKKQTSEQNLDKEKRQRRKADQIQRKFCCQAERCGRSYGSEGSLQQHIKLKHPDLFKQNHASVDQSL